MKIAFVQEEVHPYMGFMYLAAIAKKKGHAVEVFASNYGTDYLDSVKDYQPELIAFSATAPNYSFVKEAGNTLREMLPNSFILVGGWHPTFSPEILEKDGFMNAICLGEGEYPFGIFLDRYPDMEKVKTVPNFHVKVDGEIHRNPMCGLETDLDQLDFPDRSIYYDKFEVLRDQLTKNFIVGRGCAYPCTYCFNDNMKKAYKGKGKFVRFRSPENVSREINAVKSKYPLKYVQFLDDTFNGHKRWLIPFLDHY